MNPINPGSLTQRAWKKAKSVLRPIAKATGHAFQNFSGNHFVTKDGDILCLPPDMNGIDYINLRRGKFENTELQLLDLMETDHTIIEIGSNFGFMALHALKWKVSPKGTYVCVEPNPTAHATLKLNVKNFQTEMPNKNIVVVNAAVGQPSEVGTTADFVCRPNLSSGLISHLNKKPSDTHIVPVQLTSLSALITRYAPRGASLICDAEGAEIVMATKDAKAFDKIRQISIELHEPSLTGRPETPADMIKVFNKMGFTTITRHGNCCFFKRMGYRTLTY